MILTTQNVIQTHCMNLPHSENVCILRKFLPFLLDHLGIILCNIRHAKFSFLISRLTEIGDHMLYSKKKDIKFTMRNSKDYRRYM